MNRRSLFKLLSFSFLTRLFRVPEKACDSDDVLIHNRTLYSHDGNWFYWISKGGDGELYESEDGVTWTKTEPRE